MPSPTTIDEFLDLVRKSGVVDEKRLTVQLDRLRAAGPLPAEPVRLAGQLVQDGVLTHFQAEQFLQGKWRRFTIGKYKVLEKLGAGGMGSVYLCEHMLMRRRVAVKVLPAKKGEDSSSLERFYREARAVAALDHPNIVRAYDIDQDEELHFLVMEHVDGSSLQEIVKRAGPMDVLRAAHYIRQAALGLQHAHETAGIVHRDIKPGNILVDRNGVVKVLDMGLARFFHDEEDLLTKKYDENVLGTADYLAPEQALDSHEVDIRADIYSLGATFYFCLTGRTPFAEGSVAQKLIWHQTRQPKPIRSMRSDVPDGIIAIIERMMAKDPAQRYPSPVAVAEALEPWTQTPIPPPPASEMPQFSPAAKVRSSTAETTVASAARTAPELAPASRKVWQVPSSGSRPSMPPPKPPEASAPAPAAAAAPPTRQTRTAAPVPANSVPVSVGTDSSVPKPAARAPAPAKPALEKRPVVSAPGAVSPPPRQPAANGTVETQAAATMDESPSWELLEPKTAPIASAPPSSNARRSRTRVPAAKSRTGRPNWVLWGVVGGVAILVCIGVGILLYRILSSTSQRRPGPQVREPILFNPADGRRLADTVRQSGPGDRIVVLGDIDEFNVAVHDRENLTIEAEPGRRVTWKLPAKTTPDPKLLLVANAQGFRLKGITLAGDGRASALITVRGRCPGAMFYNLQLEGFTECGIYINNCEGAATNRVQFRNITFRSQAAGQAGILFDWLAPFNKIPTSRYLAFEDCTFDGPGTPLRTKDPKAVDPRLLKLPGNLKLVGP
jgi:serine/threonine protein kinase